MTIPHTTPTPRQKRNRSTIIATGLAGLGLIISCCVGFSIGSLGDPDVKVVTSPSPYAVTTIVTASPAPAATSAAPSPDPTGPATSFSDGLYEVGVDIKPGKYKTTIPADSINCYWERMKDFNGSIYSILDNDNQQSGPVTVVIAKTDKGFETSGCGTWKRVG